MGESQNFDNINSTERAGKQMKRLTGYPSIDKPWLQYYDEGFLCTEPLKQSIYKTLKEKNIHNMSETALVYYGHKISFKAMFQQIDFITDVLLAYGVKKRDNVSFLMLSCPEMIYILLAVNKLGAVANMVNPTFTAEQIRDRINDAESNIIFILDQLYSRMEGIISEINPSIKVIVPIEQSMPLYVKFAVHHKLKKNIPLVDGVMDWNHFIHEANITERFMGDTTKEDLPAVMVYSSGTTGAEKGIVLTNYGINTTLHYYTSPEYVLRRGDRFLHMGAPWLSTFLVVCLFMPLSRGISVIIEPVYAEKTFEKGMFKYKPQLTFGTISHWLYFINLPKAEKMDFSTLTYPISGGEKILPETEERINKFLAERNSSSRLLTGYGMCELGSTVTSNSLQYYKVGSVGYPILGVTVAAFDPVTNKEMKYGERGEIRVLTQSRMKEYYKRPDATSEFFWKDSCGQEWGCTGDIGYVDEDGFVYILGRKTDTFRGLDGTIHYCFDIEDVLLKHTCVDQCEVVGIDSLDGYDKLYAFIVKKASSDIEDRVLVEELFKLCKENFADELIPKEISVISKFPIKSSGKRDMEAICDMAMKMEGNCK